MTPSADLEGRVGAQPYEAITGIGNAIAWQLNTRDRSCFSE